MVRWDPSDFEEYVVARWPRLVRSALLLGCTSVADAEDVVQATLLKCVRSFGRLGAADDPDAYVHRILINTFRSARRRRAGELLVEQPPERPGPDTAYTTVDEADALDRALARLDPDQRAVVVLRFYAHLSQQQTADALRVPVGTVKSRLARACRALATDPTLHELRGPR